MLLLTFIGPENRGRSMRVVDDDDIVEVKGHHHAVYEGNLEEVDAPNTTYSKRDMSAEERIERA